MSCPVRLTARALDIAINPFSSADEIAQASHLVEQAIEAGPPANTWLQIALAYLELGEFVPAQKALDTAAEKQPKNKALPLFRALLAGEQGQWSQALQHLDELKRTSPQNQACDTARALVYLKTKQIDTALGILDPPDHKFDISVSRPVVCRLAQAIEECLLPGESPDFLEADLTSEEQVLANQTKAADDKPASVNSAAPDGNLESPKLAAQSASSDDNGSLATTEPASEPIIPHEDSCVLPSPPAETEVDQPAPIASQDADSPNADADIPLPQPILDGSASSLSSRGAQHLQQAWKCTGEARAKLINQAVQEIGSAYSKAPKAYQAAFNYGECLLAQATYARANEHKWEAADIERVKAAEKLFLVSMEVDNSTAFALHYLGHCSLVQKQYGLAVVRERQALDSFAKLPESCYVLGQSLTMLGRQREGRAYLSQATLSDMHILCDRMRDLQKLYRTMPQLFKNQVKADS